MRRILKQPTIAALCFACCVKLYAANDEIAFIKGKHIFAGNSTGENLRQLDHDARAKRLLRWDAPRKRFSYMVHPENGEMAHLVVIDLAGEQLADRIIRPDSRPVVGFMRFVEEMWWLPDGKLRLNGSGNPSNCEQFDLNIRTMEESNIQYGYRSGIVPSPDDKHTAEISPINQGAVQEERFQVLLLDNEPLYVGENDGMFIPAGPVWSSDSKKIAILERAADTGQAAVVIVALNGAFTRTPVAASVLEDPSLAWVGTKVVTGKRNLDAIQIDSETKRVGGMTADVSDELARRERMNEAAAAKQRNLDALVKKLGGTDGVWLTEDTSK